MPFGSYSLGVHKPEADIDILAIAPSNVSRANFFTSLVERLNEDDRIEELHPVPGAYTPVIKFELMGISIDLLFCSVAEDSKLRQHQGSTYPIDDNDLFNLDEPSVRSLNGARVAQILLKTVPNHETFRTVLRAVKEWANVHGLYSNVLGFLGGINYAILVACICRKYRNETPATLLKAFFQTYSAWNWPNPVTLGKITMDPPQGVNRLHVWDPKDSRDRHHLMPIITPAYPSMNSAYNVGLPQRRRLKWELKHANVIIKKIEKGQAEWKDLFNGDQFFKRHSSFLQVNILSGDADSHREWFRFVESKLRLLIAGLDTTEVQVEPFCNFFHRCYDSNGDLVGSGTSSAKNKHETCFFGALRFRNGVEELDLSYNVSEFLHIVNTWENRRQGMELTIKVVTKEDVSSCISHKSTKSQDDKGQFSDASEDLDEKSSNHQSGDDDASSQEPHSEKTVQCDGVCFNKSSLRSDEETASTHSTSDEDTIHSSDFSMEDKAMATNNEENQILGKPPAPIKEKKPAISWADITKKAPKPFAPRNQAKHSSSRNAAPRRRIHT